jgi:hypothetical protein
VAAFAIIELLGRVRASANVKFRPFALSSRERFLNAGADAPGEADRIGASTRAGNCGSSEREGTFSKSGT